MQQVSVTGAQSTLWNVWPYDVCQVTRLLASEDLVGDDRNLELHSILDSQEATNGGQPKSGLCVQCALSMLQFKQQSLDSLKFVKIHRRCALEDRMTVIHPWVIQQAMVFAVSSLM